MRGPVVSYIVEGRSADVAVFEDSAVGRVNANDLFKNIVRAKMDKNKPYTEEEIEAALVRGKCDVAEGYVQIV